MVSDTAHGNKTMKDVIRNFAPAWFAVNMGTGSISLLFHAFPYGSGTNGMKIMTLVFFFLNICLFGTFSIICGIRYVLWPDIWSIMMRDSVQSLFTGTFPMGAATIINIAVSLVSQEYAFGGKPFLYFLWGLWWLDVSVSVLCCWGVLYYMKTTHTHSLENMTTVWLLPVVTLVVASSTGGVLAPALQEHSAEYALVTVTTSVFMVSIGLSLALMILTIYLLRLIVYGLPPPGSIVSVFLPLGPTGQAGYSILLTGQYFHDHIPNVSSSDFLGSAETGRTVYAFCVCISFGLWALCTMWTIFALLSIQHVRRKSPIPFKVQTWGLIFPNGVYANLTISLGATFDSTFFRIFGSIYAVATLIMWIAVASRTVALVYNKQIFVAPCLDAMDMAKEGSISIDMPCRTSTCSNRPTTTNAEQQR